MKKIIITLFVLVALVGCSNTPKETICTLDSETITFTPGAENTIAIMNLKTSTDEVSAEEFAETEAMMKAFIEGMNKIEGYSISFTHDGENLNTEITIDFTKIPVESYETLGLDDESTKQSLPDAVALLTDQGYTCK